MIQHPDPKVQAVGQEVAEHLAHLSKLFKPDVRITFVARFPGKPDQDMVITEDDLGGAIEAIERRRAGRATIERR